MCFGDASLAFVDIPNACGLGSTHRPVAVEKNLLHVCSVDNVEISSIFDRIIVRRSGIASFSRDRIYTSQT